MINLFRKDDDDDDDDDDDERRLLVDDCGHLRLTSNSLSLQDFDSGFQEQ